MEKQSTQVEPAHAPPAASPEVAPAPFDLAGGLSPDVVLSLQKTAGNQAVARMLQRDFWDSVGDALGTRKDEARKDAEEDLADFRNKTYTPLTDYEPSSGIGLFDASANMKAGTLNITLKVAYKFIDGDAKAVAKGFRPEEFKWAAAEKNVWKARYQAQVSAQWSKRFPIRSTRKHWEKMVVNTTVRVIEDAKDPHFVLSVAKYPDDAAMAQSSVCPPGTHHQGGGCVPNKKGDESGSGKFDSNDMRPEQKLDWGNKQSSIKFARGSSKLSAAGEKALAPIVTALAGKPSAHVELTGHASTTHKKGASTGDGEIANMDLARARTTSVRNALVAKGVGANQVMVRNQGEQDAGAGDEWNRVDAQVGTHETQNPALHETGHMLGSGDEYPQTGAPAGSKVDTKYDAMIKSQTGKTIARGESADAMSMGSTVRGWNYASFMEALEKITGEKEWKV